MSEEIAQLPPTQSAGDLQAFSRLFERSSDLRDVLMKLPGHIVLQSGLSARRNQLIKEWEILESPGLDGSVDPEALDAISAWIHKAEVSIAYIIQIDKEEKKAVFAESLYGEMEVEYEIVDSVDEIDCVSNEWCWPWKEKRQPKKLSEDGERSKRLFKYGALAGLAVIGLVAYMDEDE